MQYLGIDWGTRRAAWCAISPDGELTEGTITADEDGLVRLVTRLGPEVRLHRDDERRTLGPRQPRHLRLEDPDRRRAQGQGDRPVGLQKRPRRRGRARRP